MDEPRNLVSGQIVERQFLEPDECAEAARRVMRHQHAWTKRSDFGFYTLGTAAYLDAPVSRQSYGERARETNRFLWMHFGDLYRSVEAFLSDTLGERAAYGDDCALPGFHVFQTFGQEITHDNLTERAHFDLQFLSAVPDFDNEPTLSFTLPIEEPSGGASLAVWPLDYHDAVRGMVSARDFAARTAYRRVEYGLGRMVLHDGLSLHAIGTSTHRAPRGFRVTLQGHGIRRNGTWLLYW